MKRFLADPVTGKKDRSRYVYTHTNGDKYWYYNSLLHREDGPAIETRKGGMVWFINGKEHREDDPAVISEYGDKIYYNNDKLPKYEFIELSNGNKFWYKDKKPHRDNGPAEITNEGNYWYQNGKLHRLNGPAINYYDTNGYFYYVMGSRTISTIHNGLKYLHYLNSQP